MVRDGTDDENDLVSAVGGLTIALIFAVAFGGLALDVAYWWVAFPVGFGGILPMTVALARRRWGDERESDGGSETDRERAGDRERQGSRSGTGAEDPDPEVALQTLRERYAAGEIDEVTFERRLERLLETEDVDEAAATVERERRANSEGQRERDRRADRDRQSERETAEER